MAGRLTGENLVPPYRTALRAAGLGTLLVLAGIVPSSGAEADSDNSVCDDIAESATNGLDTACVGSVDMYPDQDDISRLRIIEVKYRSPIDGEVMICTVASEFGDQGTNGSFGFGTGTDCRRAE